MSIYHQRTERDSISKGSIRMSDHRRETLELEKLNVEIRKFMAESRKLNAEALKFRRESDWYPFAVGAALATAIVATFTLLIRFFAI
ncbi:hypothetical protein [Pseudomonas coleopterorum]